MSCLAYLIGVGVIGDAIGAVDCPFYSLSSEWDWSSRALHYNMLRVSRIRGWPDSRSNQKFRSLRWYV